MLKLGKTIEETSTVIEVFTFDVEAMSWSKEPDRVEFSVAKTSFASGGFRKAYKATSRDKKFAGKQWVLKRYLLETQKTIKEMGDTEESHTKKVVQMHRLAAYMAMNLSTAEFILNLFGQTLQYGNIFLGKIGNEYITIEEFIFGEFIKYMNNTGEVCGEPNDEFCQKAECLCHFSFQKSERKLMLVDIQGSGVNLYDPEIASIQQTSDDGKILFCAGNLSKEAIDNFTLLHVCNKYCKMLEQGCQIDFFKCSCCAYSKVHRTGQRYHVRSFFILSLFFLQECVRRCAIFHSLFILVIHRFISRKI